MTKANILLKFIEGNALGLTMSTYLNYPIYEPCIIKLQGEQGAVVALSNYTKLWISESDFNTYIRPLVSEYKQPEAEEKISSDLLLKSIAVSLKPELAFK